MSNSEFAVSKDSIIKASDLIKEVEELLTHLKIVKFNDSNPNIYNFHTFISKGKLDGNFKVEFNCDLFLKDLNENQVFVREHSILDGHEGEMQRATIVKDLK